MGPSGSVPGSAIFGRVRTRAELEKLINSSVRPLYIKQEVLDEETGREYGRMDTDGVPHEDDDMRVVDVVLGVDKKAESSSEDSDSDQDMEDADVPDPVADIRRLFEAMACRGRCRKCRCRIRSQYWTTGTMRLKDCGTRVEWARTGWMDGWMT